MSSVAGELPSTPISSASKMSSVAPESVSVIAFTLRKRRPKPGSCTITSPMPGEYGPEPVAVVSRMFQRARVPSSRSFS